MTRKIIILSLFLLTEDFLNEYLLFNPTSYSLLSSCNSGNIFVRGLSININNITH